MHREINTSSSTYICIEIQPDRCIDVDGWIGRYVVYIYIYILELRLGNYIYG